MATNNAVNNQSSTGWLFVTQNFTSAEIISAFVTPIQILPQPGAGLCYLPLASQMIYFWNTATYTLGGTPQLQFETNTGVSRYQWNGNPIISTASSQQCLTTGVYRVQVNEALFYTNLTQPFAIGSGTMRINIWYQIAEVG